MSEKKNLNDCRTVYDCRDAFPDLTAWMSDDYLKELPLWHGMRFEPNQVYFDLDHPDRGAFAATGDDGQPTDRTYVRHSDVPEEIWAQLITWRQPVSEAQFDAIDASVADLGVGTGPGAAG